MKITFKHEIKSGDSFDADKLIELILKIRGIKNAEEFMNPPSPLKISLHDFDGKYKNYLEKTVRLLKEIKKQKRMIVVYTDYDADGITGGAILWETLHLLGFKVMPYVPDRKKEGYGFAVTGIDNVISRFDPALIISVDHGITKIKEIEYAVSRGVKIIVTDHHLKGEKIPDNAEAIFHIPALSGSGVAYFFSKAIYESFKKDCSKKLQLEENFSTDYAALASIGTIADLIPLVGPSRALVSYGLKAFPKVKRYGITHILRQSGIEGRPITPYEVGFMIAPRINAIGRLENAIDALRLLCTLNEKRARELAQKVGDINVKRQGLVEESLKEAKQMLDPDKIGKIIILKSDRWNEGIIGLIASKLLEIYYRPVIIMTKNGGHYKGSSRSIPSFHMTNFLRTLKENLIDVGGHAAAAGFTIEEKKVERFISEAKKMADVLINEKDLEKIITADLKIPISKVTIKFAESLDSLEPFGIGNPRPVFVSSGVITDAKIFGKTGTHLNVIIDSLEFIAFNKAPLFEKISRGLKVSVVYNLEIDRWQGRKKLRAKLIDYLEE